MQRGMDKRDIKDIVAELKKRLRLFYGKRLGAVILYGSYARNEAKKDSDIDIAVVLKGEVLPGTEIDNMLDIITDLNLKYNMLISVYPVSEDLLRTIKSPLHLNVQREGINI